MGKWKSVTVIHISALCFAQRLVKDWEMASAVGCCSLSNNSSKELFNPYPNHQRGSTGLWRRQNETEYFISYLQMHFLTTCS